MIKRFTQTVLVLLVGVLGLSAQSPADIARTDLSQNYGTYGLKSTDVSDVIVTDQYTKRHTGAHKVFLQQRYQGIEVNNALINYTILEDGSINFVGKRFEPNLATRVNTTQPAIGPAEAIIAAAQHLELPSAELPRLVSENNGTFTFEGGNYSHCDIEVRLRYQPTPDGQIVLSWDLALDMPNSADYWSVRIDATTGELAHKNNYTVYCDFGDHAGGFLAHQDDHRNHQHTVAAPEFTFAPGDTAQYLVFPYPAESPIHGTQELLINPWDLNASPFGWHDTDGEDGPEYTITRGNNTHVFLDLDDTNQSQGDEVDGGANLVFEYPYDYEAEPSELREAAQTQLFYSINFLHDFLYNYGFTEEAGNFQENNYGAAGFGGDSVDGNAQDGGGTNNANFGTPPDGNNPRMQMFLWNAGSNSVFEIAEPTSAAGPVETGGPLTWGATITQDPVTGVVVEANDGLAPATDACSEIQNVDALEGSVALIDRGGCQFGAKALRAEQAGAIGAIICNFEDATIGMAPGDVGDQVTIPVVMISSVTCQQLRNLLAEGLVVSFVAALYTGPDFVDGDFDNGVVAHEYGHGVSNRFTGGPNQAGCLGNAEQMGEGWSDFLTLVTGARADDTEDMGRGIGTWVNGEDTNGRGIRTYPYSTDMDLNPFTFESINGSTSVHFIGSVWCTMLWDMYWALTNEYGYSDDPTDMTAGNNIAIQLVMDGMDTQPCSPGFIDGRDAILAADVALTGGDNQCLLWEVFARRGLGFFAEGGDSNSTGDQTEDFSPRPTCVEELKISKAVTPFIEPGEDIEVTLTLINHKPEAVSGIAVNDIIPDGTVFEPGSGSITPSIDGNTMTFTGIDLEYDQPFEITYTLNTSANDFSIQEYFDPAEDEDLWELELGGNTNAPNIWTQQDVFTFSDPLAWYVEGIDVTSEQILRSFEPITVPSNNPTLRFYHQYDTEAGIDGGFVEISTDGGTIWTRLEDEFFRNGQPTDISYATIPIPFLAGFSGDSDGFIASYADLTAYAGQEVWLRFYYVSDEGGGGLGWFVDDLEMMELLNHNTEACITSDQGDNVCATASSRGTIVNSAIASSTNEPIPGVELSVFPNPASDVLTVSVITDRTDRMEMRLVSVDGREVMRSDVQIAGSRILSVDVNNVPAGFYFLELRSDSGVLTQKVVIE